MALWWVAVGRMVGGEEKKRAPVSDHERDIVQNRLYSPFVDKWISMLIKWDTDMSENCGECGIILTRSPYTPTTVVPVPRVWSIPSTPPPPMSTSTPNCPAAGSPLFSPRRRCSAKIFVFWD